MSPRRYFPLIFLVAAILLLVLAVGIAPAFAGEPDVTRRFALLVAANDGGDDRPMLRYAATDARALGRVLVAMGGVLPSDRTMLVDPTPAELKAAIARMSREIAGHGQQNGRTEFVFYYSGHSDETGLLLAEERVSYAKLRDQLDSMPADVRLIILDSCASGSYTRAKGGRRMPAFLSDKANQINGYAVLTSSSADEVAQESDRIQGSFFTHFLISGLRGAADVSGNRRVTLNEAYRYAFDETLRRTHNTRGGAQHAEYDIQMSGHGELVLTALQETNAVLRFEEAMSGRIWVRDREGRLIVEVPKHAGRPLELGLPVGAYRVEWASGDQVYVADVEIGGGNVARISGDDFEQVATVATTARGGVAGEPGSLDGFDGFVESTQPEIVGLGVDLLPRVGTSSGRPEAVRVLSLNLIGGMSGGTRFLEIGGAFNLDSGPVRGLQIGGAFNLSRGLSGAQIGGALNVNRGPTQGLQIGGAVNIAARLSGVQVAGALNYSGGPARGLQIGGAHNYSGGATSGLQIAGALNYSDGPIRGAQIAGALNVARDDVSGLQVGAINYAGGHVDGLQIGAINISGSSDASIGAINIFLDGFVQAEVFGSADGLTMAGIRHGSRAFYSLYFVGTRPLAEGDLPFAYGLGLGWRTQLSDKLEFAVDLTGAHVVVEPSIWRTDNLIKLRPALSLEVTDEVAIFAGPTVTVLLAHDEAPGSHTDEYAPFKSWQLTGDDSEVDVGIWPGISAGLRLF
jgi:uncharacterized caspase-like protein